MKAAASTTKDWRKIAKASLLVLILTLAMSLLSYFVANPSDRHRQVDREYAELVSLELNLNVNQASLEFDAGAMTADEQARLASLEATPESQYTMRAGAILGIVQTLFYVVVTYYLYSYIRRNGLARKAVGLVALIMTSVAALSSVILWLFDGAGVSLVTFLLTLPLTMLLVAMLSFVIASLCESWYKRRNSFEI